ASGVGEVLLQRVTGHTNRARRAPEAHPDRRRDGRVGARSFLGVGHSGPRYRGRSTMAQVATIEGERLESLAAGFSGVLLRSGDEGYEQVRRVHNALVDKRPLLIARCRGAADVVGAL